ncbi:MAG: HD domain-containing protein, partial [Anaerolineae bacterium]
TIAEMAGIAIHRTRLHERVEHQLRRLTALRDVDMAIASSFDLRVTLNILVGHALTQLGADAVAVLLFNPNSKTLSFAAGLGFVTSAVNDTHLRLGEGLPGIAVVERKLLRSTDLRADQRCVRRSQFAAEGFTTYHAIPLIAKGQIKGVLEIFHRQPFYADKEWEEFLDMLANQAAIAIDGAQLLDHLQRSHQELTMAYDTTLLGWSRALELRDKETKGHTLRVADLTIRLAQALGVPSEDLTHIRRGVLLHDVGKMGVPDHILHKPGPLTEEEWDIMRRHVQYAYEWLKDIPFLKPALEIPYCHHERWDGSGYPRGLQGEQIPLSARIFAVVDVYDALLSDRPYRKAWPREKVLRYLKEQAGKQFDPYIVEVFLKLIEEPNPETG